MVDSKTLGPLQRMLPAGFPDRLREIAEQLYLQLLDEPLLQRAPDRMARLAAIALRQTDRLSLELGGMNMYLHKGVSFRLLPRNMQIAEQFRGDYTALARAHRLSEMQVRNIVDAVQRQRFLANQCDMFPEGPDPTARSAKRGRSARPQTRRDKI